MALFWRSGFVVGDVCFVLMLRWFGVVLGWDARLASGGFGSLVLVLLMMGWVVGMGSESLFGTGD